MAGVSKSGGPSPSADINVVPLIDVVLVLLIIFMVVTPMLQKGVPVNLPVTEAPEPTPDTEKQLQISVKADGSVYLGPNVVRKDQVESSLKEIFERTPDREKVGAVAEVEGDLPRGAPQGEVTGGGHGERDAAVEGP